jgi:hypothetical protein
MAGGVNAAKRAQQAAERQARADALPQTKDDGSGWEPWSRSNPRNLQRAPAWGNRSYGGFGGLQEVERIIRAGQFPWRSHYNNGTGSPAGEAARAAEGYPPRTLTIGADGEYIIP